MPNSVSKRRSRFAMLAVFAVVASLFTAALPASAATGDVENKATFSACVAGATADGGFTDTTGNFADASIDCLKYYGITIGTTATTYSPGQNVTRAQMALFLIRSAGPAGITVPAAASHGFTDIGTLPQATQDAINQLATLGITTGTSATTYGPNDVVSRYQMALFLIRFLHVYSVPADLTPGADDASGLTDLGNVTNEAFLAIEDAWDLGITTGTSATLFSPFAAVTRDQMAAFITRTLAHTNARPSGVSMQAVPASGFAPLDVKVQISVRDSAFKPVADALVDVFQAALADKANALKVDGTCDTTKVSLSDGATLCTIDVSDPDTNANGNIDYTFAGGGAIAADTVWWAWTGSNGATFDGDTTQFGTAEVDVTPGADEILITTSTPYNVNNDCGTWGGGNNGPCSADYHKFGTTVTWTLQVVDVNDKPVALAGVTVTLVFDRYVDNVQGADVVKTATTDAAGVAIITFVESDPSAVAGNAGDNTIQLRDDFWTDSKSLGFDGPYATDAAMTSMDSDILWDDDAAAAFDTSLSTNVDYTTGTSITATARVTDQYGAGFGGHSVDWYAPGFIATRVTNPSGYTSQAVTGVAGSGTSVLVEADSITVGAPTKTVYFPAVEVDSGTGAAFSIVAVDTANDTIVVDDGGVFRWLKYDANDQFTTTVATSMEEFEKQLDLGGGANDQVTYIYRVLASNVSSFDLS